MADFMTTYFCPLGKEYCIYFYVLSIVFCILFTLSVISIVSFAIMNFKKVNSMFVVNSLMVLLNTYLAYLANRLLHTMCIRSIM